MAPGCAADRLPVEEAADIETPDVGAEEVGEDVACRPEVCNGEDDDCDMVVDEAEDAAPLCVPPSPVTMVSACEGACVDRCALGYLDADGEVSTGCECLEGRPGCDGCDAIPACVAGEATQYDLDVPASYISALVLALTADDAPDLNGDGVGDNAAGEALGSLFGLVERASVNTFLAQSIASGEFSVALLWPGWGTLSTDLHVVLLDGEPEGGEAVVEQEGSFIPGSRTPRHRFARSVVDRGVVEASVGRLPMRFTVEGLTLQMTLERVTLSGLALADGPGVRLSRTELTGALLNRDLAQTLEDFVQSPACSCLSLDSPLFTLDDGNVLTCGGGPDLTGCDDGTDVQSLCQTIAELCDVIALVFQTQPDLDLDGDGRPDAMSLYADVEAVGVKLGW